jgi:chaperonin GroEL (HSP60 family)
MAKQIKYGVEARKALEAGVNQLADIGHIISGCFSSVIVDCFYALFYKLVQMGTSRMTVTKRAFY